LGEKTEEAGVLQFGCKMIRVGGYSISKAYKNLMAVDKISIAGKELWESVTSES